MSLIDRQKGLFRGDYGDFWSFLEPVDFPRDALSRKWRVSREKVMRSTWCLVCPAIGPIAAIAQLDSI
jgi:hypothetical protein